LHIENLLFVVPASLARIGIHAASHVHLAAARAEHLAGHAVDGGTLQVLDRLGEDRHYRQSEND
jgi:hypothetical protein